MKKYLVTGAAGFIGFHLCRKLLNMGAEVAGIDNLNAYYDANLKISRLKLLQEEENFRFFEMNLEERNRVASVFSEEQFDVVVNLAAQPGVRYSLINPYSYIDSNIVGFLNVLEGCRNSS